MAAARTGAKAARQRAKSARPAPLPLDETERMLIQGIQAREQLLRQAIEADLATVCRRIEERVGLSAGAIPATHLLDLEQGAVVLR